MSLPAKAICQLHSGVGPENGWKVQPIINGISARQPNKFNSQIRKIPFKIVGKKKELNLMRVAGVFAPAWGEKLLKVFAGSWQTAQPVEGLAAKPDFLSSIPRTGMVEGARSKS